MAHSIFGWDYPPGVSSVPGDEPSFCEVCGQNVDNGLCVCPECPECGETGEPNCYKKHGLVLTEEQIRLKEKADEEWARDSDWPNVNEDED